MKLLSILIIVIMLGTSTNSKNWDFIIGGEILSKIIKEQYDLE